MVNELDYVDINFPVSKKDYCKIEQKNILVLMHFVMKMILFILFIYQIKHLKIAWIYCW